MFACVPTKIIALIEFYTKLIIMHIILLLSSFEWYREIYVKGKRTDYKRAHYSAD